jgi:hypothetical protein
MPSPNPNWGEITTTTLFNRSRRLADNVTKNNAILQRLSQRGKVKPVDGGEAIVQELEYSENATYLRYQGYDILNVSPSDVFTAAQYPWAQAACAVSISGLEELKNSGENRMIDLLEARISNAEKTMTNGISGDCYGDGTLDGGKQIGGLQLLLADVNNAGTVGGIDRALWPFWRHSVMSFAAQVPVLTPGPATIQTMMNRLWLTQVRGTDRPDLGIADNAMFRMYWESLQAIQRILKPDEGVAGFQSLKFMDMDIVFDGGFQGVAAGTGAMIGGGITWATPAGAPPNHLWFLNTDYIFLRPHRERNMVPLNPDRFAVNQDAMVKLVGWAGNMTMSNAFLQGLIIN